MKKLRTRFAPSPTGFLHIGSLRTVLFAYLIAKKSNGKFILRIEDTDQKRKVEGAEEKMIEIINWLGLKFDEGPQADIIVENKVIIELKAIESLNKDHKKQVLTYLQLTGLKFGYLLNFGEALMKDIISRIINGEIK